MDVVEETPIAMIPDTKKMEVIFDTDSGNDQKNATFVIHDEDHTVGGPLRHILHKNPDVDFAGYTIPHPLQPKMNMRIQTFGPAAPAVLHSSLKELENIGEVIQNKFKQALADYNTKNRQ